MFAPTTDPFARLHEALDECAAAPIGQWSDAGVVEAVKAWSSATSRLAGVGAKLLYRWDRTAGWSGDGAANGTQWLNAWSQVDLAPRHLRVANNLARWAPRTAAALDADELPYAKAAAIALAITEDNAESFGLVEEVILETARQVSLRGTRQLLARWKRVAETERDVEVDPDESRRDRRYLHLHETFDGMWAIEGLLDPEVGAALKEAIADLERRFHRQDVADAKAEREATAAEDATGEHVPAAGDADGPVDGVARVGAPGSTDDAAVDADLGGGSRRDGEPEPTVTDPAGEQAPGADEPGAIPDRGLGRTARQRRADALAEMLGRYQATAHTRGGPKAHLHLNVTWDQLQAAARPKRSGELRLPDSAIFDPAYEPPHTDHQHRIPDHAVARYACDCILTRLVLDEHGVPLDMGRDERLVTPAQRRALIERDGGCAYPGCDRTPEWCEAHHIIPWEIGGLTDLDNLVLLCGHHHTRMHLAAPFTCELDATTHELIVHRPDGTRLHRPGPHRRWYPPEAPPGHPPDATPAWVTAA